MEINNQPVSPMDLLNLAFIGTALEPVLPKLGEQLREDRYKARVRNKKKKADSPQTFSRRVRRIL